MYIANLQIKVDTTDLERAKKELEGLSQISPKIKQGAADIGKAYEETSKGADKVAAAGQRLIDRVQEQVSTFGKGREGVLSYKAAILGVSGAVDPLVAGLKRLKDQQQQATASQKEQAVAAKAAAKSQEQLTASQNNLVESLREEIALFGKSKEEIKLYRAGLMGISDQVEPLVRELQRLKQAKEEESKAGNTGVSERLSKREAERRALAAEAEELQKIISLENEKRRISMAGPDGSKPQASRTREAEAALESYTRQLDIVNQKQKQLDKSTDDLSAEYLKLKYAIDPVSKTLDEIALKQSRLGELFRSGKINIPDAEYRALNSSLEASRNRIEALGSSTGKTAKEINFAMRGLPAQFTDIFVSLQAGQNPLTVFLQQGGQLKDMFGGVGVATRAMGGYLLGLINPLTLAAGAVVTLAVAWYQGSEESRKFKDALILTGYQAGVTAAQLNGMAVALDDITTRRDASRVLTEVAKSGKVAGQNFEEVTRVAILMERSTGQSVEETINTFEKLRKKPLETLSELNDKYNFLTADIVRHIASLQDQGREAEAGAEANRLFVEAMDKVATDTTENLGYIQRAWKSLKEEAGEAWDEMLGIGRTQTIDERIKAAHDGAKGKWTKRLAIGGVVGAYSGAMIDSYNVSKNPADSEVIDALYQEGLDQILAQRAKRRKAETDEAEAAADRNSKRQLDALTKQQKLENEIKQINADAIVLKQSGSEVDKLIAAATAKYAEKGKKETEERATQGDRLLAGLRERQAVLASSAEKETKLTKEQVEFEKLKARFAELETASKSRTLTQDEKSVLANKDKALTLAKQNIAYEEQLALQKATAEVEIYRESLNERLAASQKKYNDAVMSVGKSKKEVEYLRERQALQEDYLKEQKRIEEVFMKSSGSDADRKLYNDRLSALRNYHSENVKAWEQNRKDIAGGQANWVNGLTAAWGDYLDGITDVSSQTYSLFTNAFKGIEDYLVSFISGTKSSFKDLVKSIGAELARLGVRKMIGSLFGGSASFGGTSLVDELIGGSGGGKGGSGGMNLGSILSLGKTLYSFVTGAGKTALVAGQSGGFTAALNSLGNSIVTSVSSLFGGAATGTASGGAGVMLNAAGQVINAATGQLVASQTVATTAMNGLSSMLSNMVATLSNPVTWIAAGAVASWQLNEAGVVPDRERTRDAWGRNTSGGADFLKEATSFVTTTAEAMDRAYIKLHTMIGIDDKTARRLVSLHTGSPISQAFTEGLARLFGSGEQFKRTVGSAQGTYSAGEYTGNGAVESWFGGSKRFGEDFDQSLHGLNEAFATSLGGLFKMFDIDSDIMAEATTRLRRTSGKLVGNFTASFDEAVIAISGQYAKKGRVEEGLAQFFDDVMGRGLSQAIGQSQLPEYLKQLTAGMTKAAEVNKSISELFMRFEAVNNVVEILNINSATLSDAGLRGADALLEMVSALAGLEEPTVADKIKALSEFSSTYFEAFFSEAEKAQKTIDATIKTFKDSDLTLASTRDGYRQMVEAIDITTDAGVGLFVSLMGLAGQADAYYKALEFQQQSQQQALEAQQKSQLDGLMSTVDASFAALQRSITAESKRTQDAYNARLASLNELAKNATSNISEITAVGNNLESALKKLRGTSEVSVKMLREQANATLRAALASARGGNSLAGFEGLQDALDVSSQMDTRLYSSLEEFEREQGRTANIIAELEALNGKQLSIEKQLLASLESQIEQAKKQFEAEMARLDAQLTFAQSQLDALKGIDKTLLAIGDAILAMNASVVASLQGMPKGAAQANTVGNNMSIVDTVYKAVLGRDAEAEGKDFWTGKLQSGEISYNQLAEAIAKAATTNTVESDKARKSAEDYLKSLGVQGYANGGYIRGPGGPKSDSILAKISNGEFVMSAQAVDRYGVDVLEAMNSNTTPAFALGGYVSSSPSVNRVAANDDGTILKLIQAVEEIKGHSRQINKNTSTSATMLREQNQIGLVIREENL